MNKSLIIIGCIITMLFTSCKIKISNRAVYEGNNISSSAEVLRDRDTKQAWLSVEKNGEWYVFAGRTPETVDFSKPLLSGEKAGKYPLDVPDSVRTYFQFVTPEGKAILAERRLPMKGGYNFRDLGGYKTREGKYVKWGKIFRSDDLYNLTPEDLNYLSSIPITSIVDFRSQGEAESAPDKLPASVAEHFAFFVSPGNLDSSGMDFANLAANADSLMMQVNISLVTDSSTIRRYKDFFALLQDEKNIPLLFHCSAGKDRTGMGAALILSALGVDEETIYQDYLLSNVYLEDKYKSIKELYPQLASLFEVKKEFLQAGIEEIKKQYGSVDNYLVGKLDVDIHKMRSLYLY